VFLGGGDPLETDEQYGEIRAVIRFVLQGTKSMPRPIQQSKRQRPRKSMGPARPVRREKQTVVIHNVQWHLIVYALAALILAVGAVV